MATRSSRRTRAVSQKGAQQADLRGYSERIGLLVGGPDAGKSNYLYRCWIALQHAPGILVPNGLPQDSAVLSDGAAHLMEARFAPRSSRDVMNQTVMPVRTVRGEPSLEAMLSVPDVSGEEWISVYKHREWSETWEESIRPTTGLLLFVRVDSDKNHTPLDWHSFSAKFGSPVGTPHGEPESDVAAGSVFSEGEHRDDAVEGRADRYVTEEVRVGSANDAGRAKVNRAELNDTPTSDTIPAVEGESKPPAPTQVILVDWLQCFQQAYRERTGGEYRPKVGVVIAAWDLVPEDRRSAGPQTWLAENFPLFAQYLEANDDEFDLAIFGVTVSDGDLANDGEFRETYLEKGPLHAGKVLVERKGAIFSSVDIMLPVAWAMGLDLPIPNSTSVDLLGADEPSQEGAARARTENT